MADEYLLRRVKKSDIKDVYNLSNQDYVRKHSINKNEISWTDHQKWFDEIISSASNIFYVVSDMNDNFLGQIRYKINDEVATVSISLSKSLKGKGLGTELLNESIKQLKSDRIEVEYILAVISDNNIASKRLFEKANFLLQNESTSNKEYIFRIK